MAAPHIHDVKAVVRKSYCRWRSDLHYAETHRGFSESITNPASLIRRIPAMPNDEKLEQFSNGTLLEIRGRATWNFQPNTQCNLSESVAIKELIVGVTIATTFTAVGDGFQNWREAFDTRDISEQGNHLAVLIPCWAYILSNFLVETQGCVMEYTNISAPSMHDIADSPLSGYRVYVGDADLKETRWWKAVLAPGQGWRSIIRTSSDITYLAPWSIEYHGDPQFLIETSTTVSTDGTQNPCPPSSEEALQYLTSYCLLHSLGTQYFAALSAALTLPLQNLLGRKLQLPKPVMAQSFQESFPLPDPRRQLLDIPYLVTLSCAIRVLSSALWTVFWEPGVDCNLASAWLLPASKVINPLIETHNYEMLVKILARHQPRVGPLWLGAILTGLSMDIPCFLRTLEAPYARPDSLASAWLELPQLFMDTPGVGAYRCDGGHIRRADRWRLLHDVGSQPYCSTPLSPWQPFGLMPLSAVELDVVAHVECKRHEKQYTGWYWLGIHGNNLLGAERSTSVSIYDRAKSFVTLWAPALYLQNAWLTLGCKRWKGVQCSVLSHQWLKRLITRAVQKSGQIGASNATKSIDDLLYIESGPHQSASIEATRSVFAWVSVGGEGWGESERHIFEHPWMVGLIPTDTDESASDGSWEDNDHSD